MQVFLQPHFVILMVVNAQALFPGSPQKTKQPTVLTEQFWIHVRLPSGAIQFLEFANWAAKCGKWRHIKIRRAPES